MQTIIGIPTRSKVAVPPRRPFSKAASVFAERGTVSFPHPHRVPLSEDAVRLYAKYTESVLLPHYFPWVFNIIAEDEAMAQEATVLDVAGGCGHFLLALCSRLPFFRSGCLIDASPGCVRFAKRLYANSQFDLTCSLQDMHRLSFADASFGLGICHDSLHHSPEPLLALTELVRVTKGRILVADLNPAAPKAAVDRHVSLIRASFNAQEASTMEHRFLESVEVAYPIDQVTSWLRKSGALILSLQERELSYAIIAAPSR